MPDPEAFWSDDQFHPGVDRQLLEQVAELHRELARLGSDDESGYRIAPALGGTVIRQKPGTATSGTRSPFSSVIARAN